MLNILNILKRIYNLDNYIFYSPIYGNVKVKIDNNDNTYPIKLYEKTGNYIVGKLTEFGRYLIGKDACTEIMIYPDRNNRDWNKFKFQRKPLSKGTPVMACNILGNWRFGYYDKDNIIYINQINYIGETSIIYFINMKYIIPIDKFNFNDGTFNEEDNYGSVYDENV